MIEAILNFIPRAIFTCKKKWHDLFEIKGLSYGCSAYAGRGKLCGFEKEFTKVYIINKLDKLNC